MMRLTSPTDTLTAATVRFMFTNDYSADAILHSKVRRPMWLGLLLAAVSIVCICGGAGFDVARQLHHSPVLTDLPFLGSVAGVAAIAALAWFQPWERRPTEAELAARVTLIGQVGAAMLAEDLDRLRRRYRLNGDQGAGQKLVVEA